MYFYVGIYQNSFMKMPLSSYNLIFPSSHSSWLYYNSSKLIVGWEFHIRCKNCIKWVSVFFIWFVFFYVYEWEEGKTADVGQYWIDVIENVQQIHNVNRQKKKKNLSSITIYLRTIDLARYSSWSSWIFNFLGMISNYLDFLVEVFCFASC